MTVKFDPAKEPGSRIVELLIGGEAVDPEKTYVLATNNFMAIGGDKYEMFADNKELGQYNAFDEILAKYLADHTVENIAVGERIVIVE